MREQQVSRRTEGGEAVETVKQAPTVAPLVDIFENAEEIVLHADFPGVKPEDISVRLEKDQLLLEGTRSEDEVEGAARLAAEYRPVSFRRLFSVPRGIDAEKLVATLKNGVLTLRLPKSESVKPRQIKVQAS